jgi:TRAP-type mannitol/chloroaromatic compound transport system substrate-binding protein
MDRRDFLKTTSAVAVAAGTVSASAAAATETETARTAPAILSGVRQLTLASSSAGDLPGCGADRLARRIETATDGRYRIAIASDRADADLTYGSACRHAGLHRAFAIFAGLPFAQGLDTAALQTWLVAGGGAMLWDELAAEHGFKPLVVGHTGASAGVWAAGRLEAASDLAGARVQAEGLAGDVLRDLGATPATFAPQDLRAALADGRLQAAEWLGPLAAVAPDLQPLAQRLYRPGFNRSGMLLSLAVAKPLWDGMSATDRAIFEACAAQEYHLSLTDAGALALIASQVEAPSKWPVRLAWSAELSGALDQAAAEVVERIGAIDPASRRIHDSYQAFRRMLGDPATA